ncbi:MAG TPA: queuosine precursor transporter [Planctomycetia bacterium]|nr:queuosine precursor transporter [Planctomycetia bacterium]
MAGFVTVMLCSNLISVFKRAEFGGVVFGAGVIFFPISYIFGDILTEVYGYARSRRVVWAGFGALVFAAVMTLVTISLPPDPSWNVADTPAELRDRQSELPEKLQWNRQRVLETVFGNTWRAVLGSLLGFLAGEFANSYVLAKMKIWTNGRHLWSRTIASTLVGELIDSFIFLNVAFLGQPAWPIEKIMQVLAANYALKVGNEVLMTPITYMIVAFLKKAENEDYYDRDTDFTPFSLKT